MVNTMLSFHIFFLSRYQQLTTEETLSLHTTLLVASFPLHPNTEIFTVIFFKVAV